jgi:hypothetical protein
MPKFGGDSTYGAFTKLWCQGLVGIPSSSTFIFFKVSQTLLDFFHCVFVDVSRKKYGSCDYKHP